MNKAKDLIEVAETWCVATGHTLEQASYQVFKDQRRLRSIGDRKTDPRLSSYEAALIWFNDNWPDIAEWPQGVERPVPQPNEVAQ